MELRRDVNWGVNILVGVTSECQTNDFIWSICVICSIQFPCNFVCELRCILGSLSLVYSASTQSIIANHVRMLFNQICSLLSFAPIMICDVFGLHYQKFKWIHISVNWLSRYRCVAITFFFHHWTYPDYYRHTPKQIRVYRYTLESLIRHIP